MEKKINVSCLQTSSFSDPLKNIKQIKPLLLEAKKRNSELVCLPECSGIISNSTNLLKKFCSNNIYLDFIKGVCKKFNFFIIIGSIPVRTSGKKFFNRSYVIDNKGNIVDYYDKINLFDVVLDKGEKYLESKQYKSGSSLTVCQLPWGKVGLSICYDLRFPSIFRKLAKKGSDFLSIPAAFTKTTGKAHWYSLIRARAIENGCFVFAPAQCGTHDDGRKTYGHSLIVDPWGEVLAEAKNKPSVLTAKVDINLVNNARAKIPAMTNYDF